MCQRCQTARVTCDGYSHPSDTQHPASNISKLKAKKSNAIVQSSRNAGKLLLLGHPCPASNPTSKRFSTQEIPLIDFFRHELVYDLSGYSCSDFWSRVVLRESMDSDCVRQAVLAIAALSQGISSSLSTAPAPRNKPSALFPWTAKSVVNHHHRTALRYYVQALSIFRSQVDVGVEIHSPRAVFIMTMLFITFELLQGNMQMVDTLMTSSINLLKGSLKQYREDDSSPESIVKVRPEEDLDDIEHMLPFLSIMGGWTPFLKTQQMNLALWDISAVDNVPDLGYWSVERLQTEWSKFFSRAMAFGGQTLIILTKERPANIDPSVLREQQTYLSHLDRWRDVLDVGLSRAVLSRDRRTKQAVQLMQLHHHMLCIAVKCCLDYTDMIWDAYEDDFFVLVERCLAFAVETKPGYHARFTLNMGILSTLGPAIAKCRNHDIRMRALEIARRMPWREGSWDAEAEMFGKIGSVLLEERGRDADGFVSAENRWTWEDGEWDTERRVLVGRYVRSVPDVSGNPVFTWLETGLDEWPDVCGDVSCSVDHAAECRLLEKNY